MKYWFLSLFFILCFITAIAQSPFFRSHPFDKSLGNIRPTVVHQDSIGKVWIGTSKGLFYFNGLTYQPYSFDSISPPVTAIGEYNQKVWVGFGNGNIAYLNSDAKLTLFKPSEGLPKVKISGILEDKAGRLWLATYGEGLYYFNNDRLYNIDTDDGLLSNDIYSIALDNEGKVWVGTDGGVNICNLANDKKQVHRFVLNDSLPDIIVKTIISDDDGNIWLGFFDNGVAKYNTHTKAIAYKSHNWQFGEVNNLELFKNKELWIGTNGNGLIQLNLNDLTFQTHPAYRHTKINDLVKDIEGNIWVLSNKYGVQSANKQFSHLSSTSNQNQAILVIQHQLWIGTQQGLIVKNQLENSEQVFLKNENIISLHQDKYGNIWAGTFGNGIFCISPTTQKTKHISTKNGLTNGSILAMSGNTNEMWLATLGGVFKCTFQGDILKNNPISFDVFQQEDGLGTTYIYDILTDSKDRVWFATDGKGITVLEQNKFTNYPLAAQSTLKTVYSITEDIYGNIWLSTAKDGIYQFDGQEFYHFGYDEGLRDLEISSLITDTKGNLLILHPTGIDLLDPKTNHIIYYGSEVGINEISPHLNAFSIDKQDNIWLATATGLIKYTPLEEDLEIHPHTQLTKVSIFLQPIDFLKNASFPYFKNHLTFEYIGLWYTNPDAVKYRYRLLGQDLDWNQTKDLRATYPSLQPGNYTFEVQSSENEGFEGVPTIQYSFVIKSPFWTRWWFILILITLGLVIFYLILNIRENRLKKTEELKKEKIEFQLQTLKSQVNPHFLFNSFNTLLTIIDEDQHLAAEYTEKLADFYRNILQYREQELVSLENEIELLQNYYYLLQKRYGSSLIVNIAIEDNSKFAKLPPLTLQMLLENAVKHNVISKSKPLTVSITQKNNTLAVSNNLQPKVTPPTSTHFGLKSINTRYELLLGKGIEIHNDDKTFTIILPLF